MLKGYCTIKQIYQEQDFKSSRFHLLPYNTKNKPMSFYPAGIYLLKVNNRNTRTKCEICSKITIKIPERGQWRRSGIFIVNFEHISHLVLVFPLLT